MRVINISYSQIKNKDTPTRILVSSIEQVVLTPLEELLNVVEREEESPLFHGGNGGNPLSLSSNFGVTSGE